MKPLRTLMGLALVVCLLAGRASAAAWVQVNAGDKKYFLPQDRYTVLEKGKDGAQENLFTAPDAAKKAQALLKKKSHTSYVVLIPNTTEISVSSVAPLEVPATTQPAKKKAPPAKKKAPKAKPQASGPFDPIESAKADTKIPPARRGAVVKFYEKLKAENPAEYAKLKAPADVKAMTEKFLNADDTVGKGDLGRTYASMFPGVSATPGGAVADPVTGGTVEKKPVKPGTVEGVAQGPSGGEGSQGKERFLPNDVAKRIAANKAAAQATLTDRLYKFLTEDDKYVDDKVRAKADVMKSLKTYTEAWVEKQLAEGRYEQLATLYVVMGSGPKVPEWLIADPEKDKPLAALLQTGSRLEKLKKAMKEAGWLEKPVGGKAGRVSAGKQEEVIAFFADGATKDAKTGGATYWATKVLNENRTDSDLRTSILTREEKPTVPGQTAGGGEIIRDPVKAFGFDALYKKGGESGLVFAPGDKVSRNISMKLYTTREADGTLTTKIGLFDITNKSDIFGQRFDIPNGPGEFTFALDDRKPGYPKYTLKFTPGEAGMEVSFAREGAEGGGQLKSTVAGLYKARAQHAVDEGIAVSVGGKKYLAIGQGSAKAGLVLFPADTGERLNAGDIVDAALYSNTAGKSSGRDVNLPGKRHLGTVDGKDYHMAFNDKLKYWEVKEGKGDDLEKPAPTTAGGNPTQGGNTQPGGQTNPDGTPVTTPDAGAEGEAALLKDGEWEINTEVSKGLADQYKSKVRVYSYTNRHNNQPGKQIGRPISERHWVYDANLPKGRAYLPFFNPTKDDMLRKVGEVRGIGKYLAVTTDQFTGYLDVSKLNQDPKTPHYLYDINTKCMVWEPDNKEGGRSFCVRDLVLLEDALIRVGAPPEMRKTILDNARALKVAEEQDLMTIESKWDKEAKPKPTWGPVVVTVTGKGGATLWPKLVPYGQIAEADGDTKNPTGGQTNAFNTVAGPNADFPKEPQTVDNQGVKGTAYFVKTSADGMVALYGDHSELAKSTSWYVMAKINLGGDKVARTGFVQAVVAADKFPGPDKVGMKGPVLPKHPDAEGKRDVISTGTLRKLTKGDAGVVFAVENKNVATPDTGTTANKYVNCMGPVLWWGLDEAKAKKVCDDNKFD